MVDICNWLPTYALFVSDYIIVYKICDICIIANYIFTNQKELFIPGSSHSHILNFVVICPAFLRCLSGSAWLVVFLKCCSLKVCLVLSQCYHICIMYKNLFVSTGI